MWRRQTPLELLKTSHICIVYMCMLQNLTHDAWDGVILLVRAVFHINKQIYLIRKVTKRQWNIKSGLIIEEPKNRFSNSIYGSMWIMNSTHEETVFVNK